MIAFLGLKQPSPLRSRFGYTLLPNRDRKGVGAFILQPAQKRHAGFEIVPV
jgi:hypothetical protein